MTEALAILSIVLLAVMTALLVALLRRKGQPADAGLLARLDVIEKGLERAERLVREELGRSREETAASARLGREELSKSLGDFGGQLRTSVDTRLGESFKQVSERLEMVQRGLGEMSALASGVGDLKRVLTNVKTRGTWGEVQLGSLLAQVLTPEQYATNVATRQGSSERVEFALKLPGRGEGAGDVVWLPIDAKFPTEDYQRLVDAAEQADAVAVEAASKQLEARIKASARDIRDKYLCPPGTTDFGVMYLPTEGLYAEVLRRPGLAEALQRDFRVVVAGPTTLAALLTSLQMGFRTLAIEQRSSEVWNLLGAVKSEFGKFGELLDRVHKQLDTAARTIETATKKTRTIERKLRDVEILPADEACALIGTDEEEADGDEGGSVPQV
ncbi:MAG: DNA recombination protein RmuC [Deltaproteobacteria bacterium]|nr:DNA recombination protein RmuC [Deltaproteobacteria bacterium]